MVLRSTPAGTTLPSDLRAKLLATGERMVAAQSNGPLPMRAGAASGGSRSSWTPLLLAASVTFACTTAFVGFRWLQAQNTIKLEAQQYAAELERVRQSNTQLLAQAQEKADSLAQRVAALDATVSEKDRMLAEAAARDVKNAQALAQATKALDAATLKIAKLETPVDPIALGESRRKLMEVPGTLVVAWKPFDLPDAPAEQRLVSGDVVWNDELEQGYLRFVGLKPNDPNVEQYQIWVIDERGMEQKVSGGVFNANVDGEIVVPITPSLDVRKVALFAVTVEKPGGTVVPDLSRRVVVAPRS
jgi:anti-sigma-K factor RskA